MRQLADTFWTIRGEMKLAGLVDLGTQMSLVRRRNGRFVLLDSYTPDDTDLAALREVTGGEVEAILNLHPYHTLHCQALHRHFPQARLFGTRRHLRHLPDLPWEEVPIEAPEAQFEFSDDLDFAVPDGIELVTDDDKVHAGSVMVRDPASGIVHVDDTLYLIEPPSLLSPVLPEARLRFHPSLAKALAPRAGAADDFAAWAERIARDWGDAPIVCVAHKGVHEMTGGGFGAAMRKALDDVSKMLDRHRRAYG